jgi:hypothetical protein
MREMCRIMGIMSTHIFFSLGEIAQYLGGVQIITYYGGVI